MMMYQQLTVTSRTIFGICTLILLISALYIWIGNMISGRSFKLKVLTSGPVLAGILTFQGISDVEIFLKEGRGSLAGKIVGNMSCSVLTVWLVILTVILIWVALYQNFQKKKCISLESVRENLDMLPDGMCFYMDDGFPVLVNITMNRLCGEIFGRGIMNGCRVWEDIREKRGKCGIEFTENGRSVSVKLNDNSVWNFQRKKILAGDREFWELTACDITEEYCLNKELEVRRKQLAQVNERLRAFSRNVKKVTRNEEILAARMKVHDEVGRSLLKMRFWLEQGSDRRKADDLLFTWKFISDQMKHGGLMEDVGSADSVAEAAGELHVTLIRQGELPSDHKKAVVITEALKECMNNTVKHAGGRKVYFSSWEENGAYHACFTNDGNPPKCEVQEKGGLKNLRVAVEEQGGYLGIISLPSFRLEIIFPEEEK